MSLEGRYKNTCCNYGKIHSYAAANTFYPSKKNLFESFKHSQLIYLTRGHFRPIYLEEIMKIGPVLIYSSQFCYISTTLRWSTLASRVFIKGICMRLIPFHIIVPLIPPNHQFRVPSSAEIDSSWNSELMVGWN